VHWLVPLRKDGTLRGDGLTLLTTPVQVKGKTKEELGQDRLLPRFPGENNGGKAYYLAEAYTNVFGIRKDTGEPLPAEDKGKDRNPVRAFRHFWQRIEDACGRTHDERLSALLKFRERYLPDPCDTFARGLPFLGLRENPKTKKPELSARSDAGNWAPLAKAGTVSFTVDGRFAFPAYGSDPDLDDAIVKDWAATYLHEAYGEADEDDGEGVDRPKICLVTGEIGQPVARSHKPKILGVPGLASGGYVVSFAREAPAFSSYGFEMGENAPVSEPAAAAYALAINELLASDDTSFRVGDVVFCYWAEQQSVKRIGSLLKRANPKSVTEFLKAPFAGIERELARQEQFLSVALSANAGRVVVRDWLRVLVERAVENLAQWFDDLNVVSLGSADDIDEEKGGPYSLFRLAAAAVRDAKELKRLNEMVSLLYRCALMGQEAPPPPVSLLSPVLDEFKSALVSDRPTKPTYPLNRSRFALIKLILLRNRKDGGFVPQYHLASDSTDAAYNLGRLLLVLAQLQKKAHKDELKGPGVVERYYAEAAAAPSTAFGVLWKLHHHHLRKLEQQGERGQRAAGSFRNKIGQSAAKFPPDRGGPDGSPMFPRQLSLEEQGRFALGFYQQRAYDRAAAYVRKLLHDAHKAQKDNNPAAVQAALAEARQAVKQHDYPDLVRAVEAAVSKLV
jgi:CRISPR-associated protein Csd1